MPLMETRPLFSKRNYKSHKIEHDALQLSTCCTHEPRVTLAAGTAALHRATTGNHDQLAAWPRSFTKGVISMSILRWEGCNDLQIRCFVL
jgi:hypothetical protein